MTTAESSNESGRSQDFELNLAPIVDCFTVLITFMLISASFLSIGVLDSYPNTASAPTTNDNAPKETFQMELKSQGIAEIQVGGRTKQTILIPAKNGKWDQEGVLQALNGLKAKFKDVRTLTLLAQNEVQYIHLIHWMETLHPLFQPINLGVF